MAVYKTTLEINGVEDVPVSVMYTAHPGCKGQRDGRGGPPIEPDEPPILEIDGVISGADGREITLTEQQSRDIEESIGEWLSGMYDEPEPERSEFD